MTAVLILGCAAIVAVTAVIVVTQFRRDIRRAGGVRALHAELMGIVFVRRVLKPPKPVDPQPSPPAAPWYRSALPWEAIEPPEVAGVPPWAADAPSQGTGYTKWHAEHLKDLLGDAS